MKELLLFVLIVLAGWASAGCGRDPSKRLGSVTKDPSGRFAYVANYQDGTVSMYTVDSGTGMLKPTSPPSVAAGRSPVSVTTDSSGEFAYVAHKDDHTISVYTIDPSTGVLTADGPVNVDPAPIH